MFLGNKFGCVLSKLSSKHCQLSGIGKMIFLVHSLSNEKISSQTNIILWFFGPSQYIIYVF